MTGRGLTKLHKLPAGPTLYTNQIPKKEVKPSIFRRQVTGDPMERKLFSSKKEVTFRSGLTHGVKRIYQRMARQRTLPISIQLRTSGVQLTKEHIAISKNVVGENVECQLSNGDCTTEKKCGY